MEKGIPIVQASKKYLVKLCLSLAVMSVLVLVASLVIQTTASASALKTPPNKSNVLRPNTACDATGSGGCNVTFSGSLSGALAATVGAATITPPAVLNGTAQSAAFTFVTDVADTRSATEAPWALSASSAGLTVNTVGGTTPDPFVITDVTAACVATSSCSNATIAGNTGSLTTTAVPYATAPGGGDLGTTAVTVTGNVPLSANT